MSDFIVEYERRYNQCKKYEMTLPDAVLCFKLLDCANMSTQERQMTLTAASDLEFASMKSALRQILKTQHSSQQTVVTLMGLSHSRKKVPCTLIIEGMAAGTGHKTLT